MTFHVLSLIHASDYCMVSNDIGGNVELLLSAIFCTFVNRVPSLCNVHGVGMLYVGIVC